MKTLKIGDEVKDAIKLAYFSDKPALLNGDHGIGKSEIIEKVAKELGIDFIVRDLSLMEPPDLIGLPVVENGRTTYKPPSFLPKSGKGFFVFEEINRCESYMRSPCLQFIITRTLNDYSLPTGWLPIAVMNPSGGDYEVHELDPALLSRFMCIEIEAGQKEFIQWANNNNVHSDVINYISISKDIFKAKKSNPRAWKYISDILKTYESKKMNNKKILKAMIAGYINDELASSFMVHYDKKITLPTFEELLTNNKSLVIIKKLASSGQLDLIGQFLYNVKVELEHQDTLIKITNNEKYLSKIKSLTKIIPGDLGEDFNAFLKKKGIK